MKFYIKKKSGFTIMEIMVAIAIGGILLFAMTKILLQNKSIFRVQNNVEKIQSDATFAFEAIAQEARTAGFRGCISGSNTGNFWVNFKNLTTSAYGTSTNGIQGFKGTGSVWAPTLDSSIAAATPVPSAAFDVLTVRAASSQTAFLLNDLASFTSPMVLNSALGFAVNDYAIISNCAASTLFQVGSVSGNTITSNAGTGVSYLFSTNSQVYKYSTINFYVSNVAGDNILYVQRNGVAEPLVNGVDGFSIMYGLDTTGGYNATKYVYANAVTNPQQIVSLRVGLVLKSAENNISAQNAATNTYSFNGIVYSPGDKYLRKVFYTTINLRNMVP